MYNDISYVIITSRGDRMNYYDEIKKELIDNEVNKKIKDYSKNKYELQKYYNVGKLLFEAGNNYGESIVKEYSKKLRNEIDNKYSVRYLFDIRKLYLFLKVHPAGAQLSFSHYRLLFPLKDDNKIKYYISQIEERNLSKRKLEEIIQKKEYERLPEDTRNNISNDNNHKIEEYIKNPIIIKNSSHYETISEKIIQRLILEDISSFLEELGNGFCFIKNEYKIKIGNTYNYIDLLLYNIKFKCYVVIELKVTELKKEHIGQIETYTNYIDKNIKGIDDDKTIGIIICKRDNKFIMEYCSDERLISKEYIII